MPIYAEISSGRHVDAATATFPNGQTKPGFTALLAPGDYVGFDVSFTDSKPDSSRQVFLKDGAPSPASDAEAWGRAVRDAAYGAQHDPLVTALPTPGPRSQFSAAAPVSDMAAVRDLARASQY